MGPFGLDSSAGSIRAPHSMYDAISNTFHKQFVNDLLNTSCRGRRARRLLVDSRQGPQQGAQRLEIIVMTDQLQRRLQVFFPILEKIEVVLATRIGGQIKDLLADLLTRDETQPIQLLQRIRHEMHVVNGQRKSQVDGPQLLVPIDQ